MQSGDIEALSNFAAHQSEPDALSAKKRLFKALEAFGRERLSTHFYMRDFLYSEISAVHSIPNIPFDPELAVKAGRGLCENLLEPLHRTFGQVVVRSAFRSRVVNAYGNALGFNCASNERTRANHIWIGPTKMATSGRPRASSFQVSSTRSSTRTPATGARSPGIFMIICPIRRWSSSRRTPHST